MAKKKKGMIAGVSYDKWLEEETPGGAPEYKLKKYSNKLIAFLDMLGIKDFVESYRRGNEHVAIDKMEQIRKIIENSTNIVKKTDSIDYLQLSDSFVFVSEPKTIIPFLKLLSVIQTRIINECDFLLRGAVTIGDAIIEEEGKYIIGPAYMQAYQLQEKDAIYPRIIVEKSVIKEIKKNKKQIKNFLQQDLDKEYFIDYIKVFMNDDESSGEQDIKIMLRRNKIVDRLKMHYKKYVEEENHNISQKYGWTIQYYKKSGVWENG